MPSFSEVIRLPFYKRKQICMLSCIIAFGIIAFMLPQEIKTGIPMITAATIIHGLVMGAFLTMIGFVNYIPLLGMKLHPLFRGAFIAVFVHLDYTIYTWPDKALFWKTIFFAAILGSLVDLLATQLYGDGKNLLEGVTKKSQE